MKRKNLIPAAIFAALAFAGSAQAALIRRDGNFVVTGPYAFDGYWTYGTVPGFTPVYNLTTRNVRCSDARSFSLYVSRTGTRHYHNFNCRGTPIGTEDWDIRCVRGSQVIHWQGGA
jgi:hypothetical protein